MFSYLFKSKYPFRFWVGNLMGCLLMVYIIGLLPSKYLFTNTYRLETYYTYSNGRHYLATSPTQAMPLLLKHCNDVAAATRLVPAQMFRFRNGSHTAVAANVAFADTSVFGVFEQKFVYGSQHRVLMRPFSIVLTRRLAEQLFGYANPVGCVLLSADKRMYIVDAVIENPNQNVFPAYDAYIAMQTLRHNSSRVAFDDSSATGFFDAQVYTYLRTDSPLNSIESDFNNWWQQKADTVLHPALDVSVKFDLQHIAWQDIHVFNPSRNITANRMGQIFIGTVLVLILIGTTLYQTDTQPVYQRFFAKGLPNVFAFIRQFIGLQLTIIPFLLFFFHFFQIIVGFVGWWIVWLTIANVTLHFYRYRLLRYFKYTLGAAAVILIVLIAMRGFAWFRWSLPDFVAEENVVVVPLHEKKTRKQFVSLQTKLHKIPNVIGVCGASFLPTDELQQQTAQIEVMEGKWQNLTACFAEADRRFFVVMGISHTQGWAWDSIPKTLGNKVFAITDDVIDQAIQPVGKQIITGYDYNHQPAIKGKIANVFETFGANSKMIITPTSEPRYMYIRLAQNDDETIQLIKQQYYALKSFYPFEYFSLAQHREYTAKRYSDAIKQYLVWLLFVVPLFVVGRINISRKS